MRILYSNLVDSASLSSSTADANYPLSAIQDRHLSRTFRTTSASSQTITFDLGSAQDADCIAILGHNLTTSATITLAANSSDSWAAPPFTTSITAVAQNIMHYFTSSTYQFWQLQITDATLSYLEIGRVFLGGYTTLTYTFDNRYTEDWQENTIQNYSRGGQVYPAKGVQYRTYQLDFPYFNAAMVTTVKEIMEEIGGNTAIAADLDPDHQDRIEPLYGMFSPEWNFSHIINGGKSFNIQIREVK